MLPMSPEQNVTYVSSRAERESMLHKALATARTALLLDPDDATAHVALGWVNIMINDFDGALVVSSRALELNPFSAPAYDVRGYAFLALGDNEKALECLRSAERLSLNHPYSGGIFSRQAISLVSLGRYEERCMPHTVQCRDPTAESTRPPWVRWDSRN